MLGGGAGSIQDMINRYRDNMKMLRKTSMFSKKKRMFDDFESAMPSSNQQLEYKTPTGAELAAFRQKLRREKKAGLIRSVFIWTFILVLISIPVYHILISVKNQIVLEDREAVRRHSEEYMKKKARYDHFIQEGDDWLYRKKWDNAIYQYKTAGDILPGDFEARFRLARACTFSCMADHYHCEDAILRINQLQKQYPDSVSLYHLKASYYLAQQDTLHANEVFKKLDEILKKRR